MSLSLVDHSNTGYQVHYAGENSPLSVFYDDEPETVEPYNDFLMNQGFTTILTNDHNLAKQAFIKYGNTASYLFDMQVKGVPKIGKRKTHDGTAVGLTLICDITQNGIKNHISHCATLTQYKASEEAAMPFDVLAQNGQAVTRLSKQETFDKFERFVRKYTRDFLDNISMDWLSTNVSGVEKAYDELQLSEAQLDSDEITAKLMGYSGVRYNLWKKNKERILKTASSDLNERVKALIYIKHNMILHCGEKPKAQADWIHQERVELSGLSAWECLTSGDLAGIDAVAHYINRVIG